ncbi:transcription elongation factor spt5, partial [Tulasnella sp. 427]
NVNPTLDEIARFTAGDSGDMDGVRNNQVDLSIIAADARKAATAVLQPGDHVEVFEGEQTGLNGTVESINGEVVVIKAKDVDIEGQKIEVPAASVRKKFKAGDHIKVMAGTNADETGLVVSVLNDTVTFLSDMSMQEVTVFAKDVREAAEVGAGTNIVGNYELHDLVQLDQQTVGVIYKTERDSFRVLDQNGQTRLVHPHQITMRKDSRRAIATDSQGYEIRIGDNMKEIDGEGRKGGVVHIHQAFYAFLHNREIVENGGVFVTRARSLASVAPKGRSGGPDLTKLNPAMAGGMVGSGMTSKGARDPLVGVQIVVVQGQFKGYLGRIKDTNGNFARVELHTQNKVITTEKAKLKRKGADGKLYPLDQSATFNMPPGKPNGNMGPPGTPNSFARATPNPYSGGTTPGRPAVNGRTPNPYNDGGRTPGFPNDGGRTPGSNAWSASARTPNPYMNQGRTPNPYGAGGGGDGGRTPSRFNDGGRTPGSGSVWRPNGGMTPNPHRDPRPQVGRTPAGAGASASEAHDPWGPDDYPLSAPTPGAMNAPTPGVFAREDDTWGASTAPTPGGWGAPTPYSAPTPGVSSAPTPGFHATPGPGYARTPGLSAPTPGITAPTPGPGSSWHDPTPHRDDHWLFGCTDIWVEIGSDPNGKLWMGGEFDGELVMVLSVQDYSMNVAGLENIALVKFPESSPNSGLQREVPVNNLQPVRPKVGETAMVVNTSSDMRHSLVKVTQLSSDMAWFQEVDVRPGHTARDGAVPLEDLVKAVTK